MNTCKCNVLKEFRPVKSNNPVTYQCLKCKNIYIADNVEIEDEFVVALEHTDTPFKSYVRKPVKKD